MVCGVQLKENASVRFNGWDSLESVAENDRAPQTQAPRLPGEPVS
ncbi:hypothetical protein CCACVL1_09713 [Corchorus capsularis]|uniref:Uncharacterized protein n=1 Tax=Corchorus capsularis TaxID=210143 RepID=A0A1R3IUF9_COCAP|nr:hypothetical protein CCACVL1_09713 [Corchorus capsularis]